MPQPDQTEATLRTVIRDLLPSGPFWRTPAADRFIRALARAVAPTTSLVTNLRNAIFPATAARPVLEQWWNYIRTPCILTPADAGDLRARVLDALAARPAHTFAGLQQLVAAHLPFVELRQHLPRSSVPMPIPGPVNPHARIIEVWHSPILDDRATVECIVRAFAQAADTLRITSPATTWRSRGTLAHANALHWRHAPACELVLELIRTTDNRVIERVVHPLPTATGAVRGMDILTTADLADHTVRWHLQRRFNTLPRTVTPAQSFAI